MFKFQNVDYLPEEKQALPKTLFAFMWFFVRQMRWYFLALLILFTISSSTWAMVPYYIGQIVETMEMYANAQHDAVDSLIRTICFFVFVCFLIQPICVHLAIYIQARTFSVFTNIVRRQLALYSLNHSYGFFQSEFSGRLAGKIVETPSAIRDVIDTALHAFLWSFMTLTISMSLLFTVSMELFYGAIVWLFLYVYLIHFFTKRIKNLAEQGSIERSHVRGRAVDILSNIITVKFFSNKDHEDSYLLEKLKDTAKTFEKSDLKIFHLWIWLEILSTVFWFFVVGYSIYGWVNGDLTTGNVAMIFPVTIQLTEITWKISTEFSSFFQRLGEVEEGMEAITKSHDTTDVVDAIDLENVNGSISFDNVSFSYDQKKVFSDLGLTIPKGQKLGLVGQSGAGKSSLVSVLLRLYDIQSGAITIDGQDISKVTQESLRKNIAVIPQDTSLFHRTLMDNIRYGRLNASDDEVIDAAKKAHAHDFISKLPDGYETMVGERGVKLSGGQRQRIAIARAILKDAPILILDEATSALDSESEKAIQDSLKTLMEGKTVIAIAHRLSTIAHLDRIIVMDDGQIVEDGTHEELIKNDRHYAMLWSMQSGGFLQE